MAIIVTDDVCTDPVRAHSNSGKTVTVTWGSTSVQMSVAEAVDLVDAVATVLGNIPADALSPAHATDERSPRDLATAVEGSCSRQLSRDEGRVRADAEVRESL